MIEPKITFQAIVDRPGGTAHARAKLNIQFDALDRCEKVTLKKMMMSTYVARETALERTFMGKISAVNISRVNMQILVRSGLDGLTRVSP